MVVRKGEVDQQHLAGEPLAERGGEVDGDGRAARAALRRVDGHGRGGLLGGDHPGPRDQVGQRVLALLDQLGQLDDRVGVGRQRLVERLAVEGQQLAVFQRSNAGGACLLGDQRHLAEEVVGPHERDRDRVARGLLDEHLAAARLDHEHRVAGVALVDDDRALGGRSRGQAAGEGVEDVVGQREEDRHTLEDLKTFPQIVGRSTSDPLGVAHRQRIIGVRFTLPRSPGRMGPALPGPGGDGQAGEGVDRKAQNLPAGRLSRRRSRGVAWPNTRPCQGRERRFESGRDRHNRPARRRCLERWPSPVEGDGLENRYGSLAHREFKSLPLRHPPVELYRRRALIR